MSTVNQTHKSECVSTLISALNPLAKATVKPEDITTDTTTVNLTTKSTVI